MNEAKFNQKSEVYTKARPSYPDELFDYLSSSSAITRNSCVADIGSGTGIFTTGIARFVQKVYAVEPNDEMRKQAQIAFSEHHNIVSVNATAEQTLLPADSVDCVTVAQAFHWFDRAAFKAECQRILKGDGRVILIWNDRDNSSTLIKENYRINAAFCPDFKGASNGISFDAEDFDDFFCKRCELQVFQNTVSYDLETFIFRNLSSSYAPKQGDAQYEQYIQALSELFQSYNTNGTVEYPYLTRCYIGTV